MDRLKSITAGAGLPEQSVTTFAYTDTPPVTTTKSQQQQSCGASGDDIVTTTRYDGLGRAVRETITDSSGPIYTDTVYDALGRVLRRSNPYRPGATVYYTDTAFDDIGRPYTVTTPAPDAAVTSYSYVLNATTIQDPASKMRKMEADALGRVVKVTEAGDPALITTYDYDGRGSLTKVRQGVQVRTFSYDGLGRLTLATNPENRVAYTYFDNGNLKTRTDAASVQTSYSYDEINRMKTKSYSGGSVSTPAVTYCYDGDTSGSCSGATSGAHVIGRITRVVATDASGSPSVTYSTSYGSYDALGRFLQSVQSVPPVTAGQNTLYMFSYKYNLAGGLETETYPSTRKVSTCYDAAGRPKEMRNGDTTSTTFYASGVQYAEHGAVKQLTLGNGLVETRGFSPTRLQPTTVQAGGLLTLSYAYGTTTNNGNVVSQTITAPKADGTGVLTLQQTYGYDALNRLISTSEGVMSGATGGSWKLGHSYDAYGNQWVDPNVARTSIPLNSATPTASTQFDANNRLSKRQGGTALPADAYDAAGNLHNHPDVGAPLIYDAENRLVSSGTTTFSYDGEGRRVKKVAGGVTTYYVYEAAGQLAAEYSVGGTQIGSGTQYLTADHLGSTRLVTNGVGVVVSRKDYFPFGEEIPASVTYGNRQLVSGYNAPSGVTQLFTGKERDAETGLDYFGARYFSGAQGRFTSPDQPFIDQDPSNPQSWNLYNYGRNNPLRYVDPTGRECVSLGNGQYGDDQQGSVCDKADFTPYTVNALDISQRGGDVFVNGQIVGEGSLEHDYAADFGLLGLLRGAFGRLLGGAVAESAGPSLWSLGNFTRGNAIERALGANLPRTFPTIDKFINGVATSIKSVDLRAVTYQSPANLTRLLTKYVDKVAEFPGATLGEYAVNGSQITGRVLEVAVPQEG